MRSLVVDCLFLFVGAGGWNPGLGCGLCLLFLLLLCLCRYPQILDNIVAADIYVERFLPESSQREMLL
jgi:hypothetical protein